MGNNDMMTPPAPQDVTPPSAAPNLPAPTPAVATPSTEQPQQTTQAPAAPPAANKPHPLARALDAVLKSATGGDVYYTDPETGERKVAPQSRGTLGRTLIAATLAGMLSKNEYYQTPFGPVRDFAGSAGNAFQTASGVMQAARNKPQQLSDEQQAAKLRVIETNARAVALHTAQWRFKQDQYAANKPTIDATNNALQEYETNRNANDPTQPSAWVDGARGLSERDVLSKGYKLTDSLVYQDGQAPDGSPTYAIINPKLQNVTLTKEQTDLLSSVNSAYKNIHAVVGGKVTVPMSTFISGMQDVAMVKSGLNWINQLNHNEDVNGDKAKDITEKQFEDAIRSNPLALKTMWALTHASAAGNLPDQRADNLLATLASKPGGDKILALMGMTPQQANSAAEKIANARTSQQKLAEMGGIGPKAPASPDSISNVKDSVTNNKDLTDTQKDVLLKNFPAAGPDGEVHMTQGQLKDIENSMRTFMTKNQSDNLAKGDPQAISESINNAVFGGEFLNMEKLFTYARGNPTIRAEADAQIQKTAKEAGLDPNEFTMGNELNKFNKQAEFTGGMKTKTGQQMIAFNTLLGHVQDAYTANENWVRSNTPYAAKSQAWWAKNMSNDPNYLRFQDDIIAPAKEYMSFLNQNRAEHTQDIESLERVLDPKATPREATQALDSFLRTADVRAANLANDYIQVMGTTYPVVSGAGADLLNKVLGGKSKAVAASTAIPRGWVGNSGEVQQRSRPTPQVLQAIFAAADGNVALAKRLANNNGWVIPPDPRKKQ